MNIPFGKPILGPEEKEAVLKVLSGDIFVHGPITHEFEHAFAEYTHAPHAVSVASCTAGLHLAYFYLDLREGDEVIVPAQTHTATAHAVELMRATPVFVDAEIKTGNIDIDQIESKITPKTKALSVVHYLGMPVDMDRIQTIAKKHGLFVVEDSALAIGTKYKGIHAGLHGDLGCFSFYPVKHMTTAEGGMVLTRHAEVAKKLERQRAFGVDRTPAERKTPGVYDVTMLGLNYRMNELEAAIGIQQLKRMPGFLKARKENYDALTAHLKTIDEIQMFESTHGDFESSYYCHSVLLSPRIAPKRYEIVMELKNRGIGTSVYYPEAVPLMSYYAKKYGARAEHYPIAHQISSTSIALPVGPHLNPEHMKIIATELKNAIHKVKEIR